MDFDIILFWPAFSALVPSFPLPEEHLVFTGADVFEACLYEFPSLFNGLGDGLAAGSEAELTQARLVLSQMVPNLRRYLGEEKYVGWRNIAENLLTQKKNLDDAREQLLREINSFRHIPIVPRKCKYIKWALKSG